MLYYWYWFVVGGVLVVVAALAVVGGSGCCRRVGRSIRAQAGTLAIWLAGLPAGFVTHPRV